MVLTRKVACEFFILPFQSATRTLTNKNSATMFAMFEICSRTHSSSSLFVIFRCKSFVWVAGAALAGRLDAVAVVVARALVAPARVALLLRDAVLRVQAAPGLRVHDEEPEQAWSAGKLAQKQSI